MIFENFRNRKNIFKKFSAIFKNCNSFCDFQMMLCYFFEKFPPRVKILPRGSEKYLESEKSTYGDKFEAAMQSLVKYTKLTNKYKLLESSFDDERRHYIANARNRLSKKRLNQVLMIKYYLINDEVDFDFLLKLYEDALMKIQQEKRQKKLEKSQRNNKADI